MGVVNKMLLVAKEYNLRKSAPTSASIRGKCFGTLNLFKVQERFPADYRRFFAQIFADRRSERCLFFFLASRLPRMHNPPRGGGVISFEFLLPTMHPYGVSDAGKLFPPGNKNPLNIA
jgi:hypothetical protein